MDAKLGKLTKISLRKAWNHEALDFTRWLSEEENLSILSDEEAQAILYHDGLYIEANSEVAHRECLLLLLLQFADNWQVAANEEGRK
jgi:hypothetical protein